MNTRKTSGAGRPEDWAWLDALVGQLDDDAIRATTEEPAQPLREAARIGFRALDRGEFKEFDNADDLERYLENIIGKSPK